MSFFTTLYWVTLVDFGRCNPTARACIGSHFGSLSPARRLHELLIVSLFTYHHAFSFDQKWTSTCPAFHFLTRQHALTFLRRPVAWDVLQFVDPFPLNHTTSRCAVGDGLHFWLFSPARRAPEVPPVPFWPTLCSPTFCCLFRVRPRGWIGLRVALACAPLT